ncbi:hypothetical protein MsAg5_15370 [Methanosarcinaceae archaeon Ag5]|uniref:Uncharacterized protein n=1 Tax=Methanolapillus africanus TaxID=3028297 RepID=A0AAE4ML34_9EURY|nr:hypothetical protein [Methanosarcinaceae archaeon Ag5]
MDQKKFAKYVFSFLLLIAASNFIYYGLYLREDGGTSLLIGAATYAYLGLLPTKLSKFWNFGLIFCSMMLYTFHFAGPFFGAYTEVWVILGSLLFFIIFLAVKHKYDPEPKKDDNMPKFKNFW